MTNSFRPKSTHYANGIIAAILILVPFHAFLTVWGASLVGHYTTLRLWDEMLLVGLSAICIGWLFKDKDLRKQLFNGLIFRLMLAYVLLTIALGLIALSKHEVTMRAFLYALVVNLRFFLFFIAVGLAVQRSSWLTRNWPKLVFIPSLVVSVFAVLQFSVLPHNFLGHFGYNAQTIAPFETINHNAKYIRVESTLRGANPLGAYLVIILALIGTLMLSMKKIRYSIIPFVIAGLALIFTFSRSAWIGAVIGLGLVVWLRLKTNRQRFIVGGASLALVAILGGVYFGLRHNTAIENAVFHTDAHSQISVSSNQAHATALSSGLRDVFHEPFGRGPGTAGPASEYNTGHPSRIAENYFVQIAQEVGWAGLLLLLGIMATVSIELYRSQDLPLARGLLAALIGITFVNLLSHAWVDDSLAYLWWGLAGIACAFQPIAERATIDKHERNTNKSSADKETTRNP